MTPLAVLSQNPRECHVCGAPTKRIRSMTHLNGPPTLPQDFVRICLDCDEDWTLAITRELTDNPPPKKQNP